MAGDSEVREAEVMALLQKMEEVALRHLEQAKEVEDLIDNSKMYQNDEEGRKKADSEVEDVVNRLKNLAFSLFTASSGLKSDSGIEGGDVDEDVLNDVEQYFKDALACITEAYCEVPKMKPVNCLENPTGSIRMWVFAKKKLREAEGLLRKIVAKVGSPGAKAASEQLCGEWSDERLTSIAKMFGKKK